MDGDTASTLFDMKSVITTLTIAAGLALGIERTLELLKHFIDSSNGSLGEGEQQGLISRAEQAIVEARVVGWAGFLAHASLFWPPQQNRYGRYKNGVGISPVGCAPHFRHD
jgi:hypothetical protein